MMKNHCNIHTAAQHSMFVQVLHGMRRYCMSDSAPATTCQLCWNETAYKQQKWTSTNNRVGSLHAILFIWANYQLLILWIRWLWVGVCFGFTAHQIHQPSNFLPASEHNDKAELIRVGVESRLLVGQDNLHCSTLTTAHPPGAHCNDRHHVD